MKQISPNMDPKDFETVGHEIRHACANDNEAEQRCALLIHAYNDSLTPAFTRIETESERLSAQKEALHSHLYDRAVPVSDAEMLTQAQKVWRSTAFAICAGLLSISGNFLTFDLLGYGVLGGIAFAVVMTIAPLLAGYRFHEAISTRFKHSDLLATGVAVILFAVGIVEFANARRMMFERVDTPATVSSYVEQGGASDPPSVSTTEHDSSDIQIEHMKGMALFWISLASELMLGLFVGEREHLRTQPDYIAWMRLKAVNESLDSLAGERTELSSRIEAAKKWCMAGILRAKSEVNKRKPPYHRAIVPAATLFLCFVPQHLSAQKIEHEEVILIDQSASISRGPANHDLFRKYLDSARELLLSAPPNTQIRVSLISTDSFGGVQDLVKGWTPDARGVFTDNPNRARHQLAAALDRTTSGLSATAPETDIFGALWHVKVEFESRSEVHSNAQVSHDIWILSDMMNETKEFPMPKLLQLGPEQMLEQAKHRGLVVPLPRYRVRIVGASTVGLSAQQWMAMRKFWEMYFSAADAQLVLYSSECGPPSNP